MQLLNRRSIFVHETAWRVVVDCISLGLALYLAFSTYLLGVVVLWRHRPNREQIELAFSALYLQNIFSLVLLGIIIFTLFGFYTHSRGYLGRFKAVVIFNAVSLTFVLHGFIGYFMLRFPPVPRGVTVLAWIFSLALVGGSRFGKGYVQRTFHIERKVKLLNKTVRNVLVIGGAGYIGSVLTRQLLGEGFKVRVLDSLLFGDVGIAALRGDPRFELLEADFRHVESVVKAVQGMDAVIHLGAIVGDPACKLDNRLSVETNLAATAMIKSVCRGSGIQRLLFASTCSVYGAREYILDEKSAPEPISLYACTKIDSERVILNHRAEDFVPTVLRLATAFGWSYRPRLDLVVSSLTVRAIFERRITIFNKTQWRPFIHVDDIARAFVACLRAPASVVGYEIFNVGSNNLNATLGDLAQLVKDQIPDVEIGYVEKVADHRNYRVSFDKIHSRLGFTCLRNLEYGINEVKAAVLSGLITEYRDAKYYNDQTLAQLSAQAALQRAEEEAPGASQRFLRKSASAAAR